MALYCQINAQGYHNIKGLLLYSNGVPATGLELTVDEINAETVSDENGAWEIKVPYSFDPSKHLTLRLNENTPYSFHKDKDSVWVDISPSNRGKLIKLVLYHRPVLLMHKEVPVIYDETYDSKYTVFLFTLSERLSDIDLWKIKKKINTSVAIEVHSNYDYTLNHQLRYTIGRFNNLEDAETFLEFLKTPEIQDFLKNNYRINLKTDPPYIVNLLLAKPAHTFYRVQVRSSSVQITKTEKVKIENMVHGPIVEIPDASVTRKKFDYFVDSKFDTEQKAREICLGIKKSGLKDAYIVRFQVLENKIVRVKPIASPLSTAKRRKRT